MVCIEINVVKKQLLSFFYYLTSETRSFYQFCQLRRLDNERIITSVFNNTDSVGRPSKTVNISHLHLIGIYAIAKCYVGGWRTIDIIGIIEPFEIIKRPISNVLA